MTIYRHKKRGTTYEIVGEAEAQVSTGAHVWGIVERPLRDGDQLTVYRCIETGKLWARFPDEFHDGRFEEQP